jgi:hypothetical protein
MSETRLRNKLRLHLSNASNCENGLNESLLLCYNKIMELCKKGFLSHCIFHIRDVNQNDCELHQEVMDWMTENASSSISDNMDIGISKCFKSDKCPTLA